MLQLETYWLEPLPNDGARLRYLLKMRFLSFGLPRWLNRPLVRQMMLGMIKLDKMLAGIGPFIEAERAGEQ
jgi:hypothetical protein